jgi:hypothetical protein
LYSVFLLLSVSRWYVERESSGGRLGVEESGAC